MNLGIGYQYADSADSRIMRQRQRLWAKLQSTCTHIHDLRPAAVANRGTSFEVHYAFETFVGTLDYRCMLCGAWWSEHRIRLYREHQGESFSRDPQAFLQAMSRSRTQAAKLTRKLNRLGGAPE